MSTINVELFYDGVWNDTSAYEAEGWKYKIGPSDITGVEHNEFAITLTNDTLAMDPSNVLSPLYGKIARNIPARLKVDGTVCCSGEGSSWKPQTTVDHVPGQRGRSWTDFEASGILRRIGRWEESSLSPMRRQILGYGSKLSGYWPLEDPVDSENLTNEVALGKAGGYSGDVELGADDGAAGASAALTIGLTGKISGEFRMIPQLNNGYQICLSAKLEQIPASGTYIALFAWSDTMNRTWYWRVNNIAYEITAYDEFGAVLGVASATFGDGVDPSTWTKYRCKVSVAGSTLTFEPAWHPQDAVVVYGTSGSFINVTVGNPRAWNVVGNSVTDGASIGHVFGLIDPTVDITGNYDSFAAFNAYNGETSRARFVRLMNENSLSYSVLGSLAWSCAMGRQPRGTLTEILDDLVATEGGILYDDPSQNRLVFRMNYHLLNQTPKLALTKNVNVAPPFQKIIDDQGKANDITGVNWDGSQVRVEKTTGALSTAVPPAGVGRYAGRLEVSFQRTEHAYQRTAWEVAQNTLERPRYASVTVDLLAAPSLKTAAASVVPGDIISVAGEEPITIYLLVVQIERQGGAVRDTITFKCLPGDLYMSGKADDGVGRADSKSTTVRTAINATATTLAIKTQNVMETWRLTGPYDIIVLGERMTVTSCTAPVLSGGFYNQDMTVVRSVNTAVRSHAVGEEVHVYDAMEAVLRGVQIA